MSRLQSESPGTWSPRRCTGPPKQARSSYALPLRYRFCHLIGVRHLPRDQGALPGGAIPIVAEFPQLANDPVAGDQNGNWITRHRAADCSHRAGVPDLTCNILVRAYPTPRYSQEGLPHLDLEIGALEQDVDWRGRSLGQAGRRIPRGGPSRRDPPRSWLSASALPSHPRHHPPCPGRTPGGEIPRSVTPSRQLPNGVGRDAVPYGEANAAALVLPWRHGFCGHEEVVQPPGAGKAEFETWCPTGSQNVAASRVRARGVRNCRKRLGLIPAQCVNVRWKWNSLTPTARATSTRSGCRAAF